MVNNRDYKQFIKGGIYHIYNRGNDKINIFNDHEDYHFFMLRLNQNLGKAPVRASRSGGYTIKVLPSEAFKLISFCLMPNHFHLLLEQKSDIPISRLLSKICTSYSKYFNKKHVRVGTLFQDQFKAVRIKTDEQLLLIIEYIRNNPVEAGLIKDSESYPYTSYFDRDVVSGL